MLNKQECSPPVAIIKKKEAENIIEVKSRREERRKYFVETDGSTGARSTSSSDSHSQTFLTNVQTRGKARKSQNRPHPSYYYRTKSLRLMLNQRKTRQKREMNWAFPPLRQSNTSTTASPPQRTTKYRPWRSISPDMAMKWLTSCTSWRSRAHCKWRVAMFPGRTQCLH